MLTLRQPRNPCHDTVLYSRRLAPRKTINNIAVKVPVSQRAKQVVLPDSWDGLHSVRPDPNFISLSMTALVSWPRLEEIMIWPQLPPKDSWYAAPGLVQGKRHWSPRAIKSVFGNEHIRLVDLANDAEVNSIVAELLSGGVRHDLPHLILRARDLHKGILRHFPNYWAEVVQKCEKGWLVGKFAAVTADPQAQHGSRADSSGAPVDIALNNFQFDRENSWVKEMLSQMPRPRPVFLLARTDTGAFLDNNARAKHTWLGPPPQYEFDDRSRLFKKAQHSGRGS